MTLKMTKTRDLWLLWASVFAPTPRVSHSYASSAYVYVMMLHDSIATSSEGALHHRAIDLGHRETWALSTAGGAEC